MIRLALSRANVVDASASNRMAVRATSLYLLGVVIVGAHRRRMVDSTGGRSDRFPSSRPPARNNAAYVAGRVCGEGRSHQGQDGEAAQLGQLVWFISDISAERPQHQQPGARDCEETAHG
jgi:hypothetical protein